MPKNHIYEHNTEGDRQTIVRTMNRGDTLDFVSSSGASPSTVVFKRRAKVKVTQQWDTTLRRWVDISYDLENAVDAELAPEPPEPPKPTFWQRIKAWFFADAEPNA